MPKPNDTSMQDLKPTVWIGKQGSTETMIEEIVCQLRKRKLIKVKWLQHAEVDPAAIAAQAKARLVEVRGRTMVLADKSRAQGAPGTAAKAPAKVSAKAASRAAVTSREKPAGGSRAGTSGEPKKGKPAPAGRSSGSRDKSDTQAGSSGKENRRRNIGMMGKR